MNFEPFCGYSNHVHAGAFHFVEEGEAEEYHDEADDHAGANLPKVNGALPHEGEAEGFDDEDHGVQGENPAEVLGNRTERIGDATGIHPELHEEPEHDLQVAEAGGESGDEATDAKAEGGHLEEQDGQDDDAPAHFDAGALG